MDKSDGILWELELLKQAADEMQKDNSQTAFDLFNEVLSVNPIQGWHTYYARGLIYGKWNNYQEAIEDFDRASKILRDSFNKNQIDIDTFSNLFAEIIFHQGVAERRVESIEQLRRSANLNTQNHNYQAAIEDYTRLLELTPNDAQIYWCRKDVWHSLGNYQEGIKDCTQLLKLRPNAAEGYFARAAFLEITGNLQEAIDDCTQALSIDNSRFNYDIYILRGGTYVRLKNYQAALQDFNQSISLEPENISGYQKRGYCYYKMEDYHEAIKDFTQVISREPTYYKAYYRRAGAYFMLPNEYKSAAASDYESAARLSQAQGDTETYQSAMKWVGITGGNSSISDNNKIQRPVQISHVVAAIFFPPLGVYLTVGLGTQFWINLVLTFAFTWIPGVIHALWLVFNHD